MTQAEQFFFDNAGYSYGPGETPEQGKLRCAQAMAKAELDGREAGLSFQWREDDRDSSDWSDERPAWKQYVCACYGPDGAVLASLHGIDFGRDGTPESSSYRRVVEAELASEALTRIPPSLDAQLEACLPDWESLVAALIPDICDDYRASDDPSDDTPGMQLTIGFTPATPDRDASWHYQTGDNSYTGGAYGHRHWGVVSLYRDSDAKEVAEEIADQLGESCWDMINYGDKP